MKFLKISLLILFLFQPFFTSCSNTDVTKNPYKIERNPNTTDLYMAEIAVQIHRSWSFESESEKAPTKLTAIIFTILPDGTLKDIILYETSGNNDLDEYALAKVKAASPVKPFPEDIEEPFLKMGLRFSKDGVH